MTLRASSSLPRALDRRLLLYTLAAGTAISAVPASQAEVLFTPSVAVLTGINNLSIDMNHDGSTDFILRDTGRHCSYGTAERLMVYGVANNGVATDLKGEDAVALRKTARIPFAQRPFEAVAFMTSSCFQRGVFGKWANVTNRFLGVKFRIGNEVHYGWIGFRYVNVSFGVYAALGGWAYETEADKAILAGDKGSVSLTGSINPTSLEILAAGHTGIEERRKRNVP